MDISFKRDRNTLVVLIEGEIDHHTSKDARDRIDCKFIMEPVKNIIIDLSKVSFMDSSGIGLITGRLKKASSIGGTLAIKKPSKEVLRILKMSKIDSMIELDA